MITNLIDKPTNKLKNLSNTMSEQFQNPRKKRTYRGKLDIPDTHIYGCSFFRFCHAI